MANTTKHGLTYPDGPEKAGIADNAIKTLAEQIDTKINVFSHDTLRVARSLTGYDESNNNLTGHIVVHTDLSNQDVLCTMRMKGYVYQTNNIIDCTLAFFITSSGTITNMEYINNGTKDMVEVLAYKRSNGKFSFAFKPDSLSNVWHYPKVFVDMNFAHGTTPTDASLKLYSMQRMTSFTGYTLAGTFPVGWQNFTFAGAWVNNDPNRTVQFIRNFDGWIRMRGVAKNGTGSIGYLPVGYRPEPRVYDEHHFPIVANSGFGFISIRSDGLIQHLGGSNAWIDFSNVSFRSASP